MKFTISFFIFFSSICVCNSQNINLKLIEQIADISFWSIDDVMLTGYGFKEMNNNEERTKKYGKVPNRDIGNFIRITVKNNDISPGRTVELLVGPNYSIDQFKDELVENRYLYEGKYYSEDGNSNYLKYVRDKFSIIVSEEPNEAGANRIMMAVN